MMRTLTLICFLAIVSWAQSPSAQKIEPPSWWAGHSISTVRLLVRGNDLQGADVNSKYKGLSSSNIRVNSSGTYLFFDLAISKDTIPGIYEFEIVTQRGRVSASFEILPTLDRKANFQGISNDDVLYLIMTDRFSNGDPANDKNVDRSNPRMWHGGDFRGVINRLDYLKELGITAIWLTPWYDNSDEITTCDKPWCPMASYHGYGAIDYYGVENHFGSMADLRELVQKAHEKGIKVIQDQVANHVGFRHPWTKNPPLDSWFTPFKQNTFNNSVLLSPNASAAERDNLLKGWFDFSLPDMNHEEPEVVRYQIQNALWWIGMTGIDGIRQDTIQYMPRKFIRDWSLAIKKEYPKFWMVGEVFEEDSAHTSFFQGGKTGWDGVDTELPSVFDFKLWRTSQEVFTGKKPARALRDVMKYDGLYPNINNVAVLANNHDTDRFMSLPGATLDGAMQHIAFILSVRGIPQLYAGEEIAMTGGHDPDNRKDFPGGWTGDARNAFVSSGRTRTEQEMFDWVKKWIELRRTNLAVSHGRTVDLMYDDDVYVFERKHQGKDFFDPIIFAFNRSSEKKEVKFDYRFSDEIKKKFKPLSDLTSEERDMLEKGYLTFSLPPKSATAYSFLNFYKLPTQKK